MNRRLTGTGALQHDDMGQGEQVHPPVPGRQGLSRIAADQQQNRLFLFFAADFLERVDHIGRPFPTDLTVIDGQARAAFSGQFQHGAPVISRGKKGAAMRRYSGRHQVQGFNAQLVPCLQGSAQMSMMYRIEGATHDGVNRIHGHQAQLLSG